MTNAAIILASLIDYKLSRVSEPNGSFDDEIAEIESALDKDSAKPLYVFVDSHDSVMSSAPFARYHCDRGLARAIAGFRQRDTGGSRLRVCGAVQLAAIARDIESWPAHPSGTLLLTWGPDQALDLLANALAFEWRRADAEPAAVAVWLKEATIYNPVRNCEEVIADYLIRHTRYVPRDVMQLVARTASVLLRYWDDEANLDTAVVFEAVEDVANAAARQEIRSIAIEIAVAHGAPFGAGCHPPPEHDSIDGAIADLLRGHLKSELIGADAISQLESAFRDRFPSAGAARLSDLLWRHRLIAARSVTSPLPPRLARPTGLSQYPVDAECLASTILTNMLDLKARPKRVPSAFG